MKNPLLHWRKEVADLTQEQVAAQFGVSQGTVAKWEDGQVPAARALMVHELTGIALHELRPDIYPAPAGSGVAA